VRWYSDARPVLLDLACEVDKAILKFGAVHGVASNWRSWSNPLPWQGVESIACPVIASVCRIGGFEAFQALDASPLHFFAFQIEVTARR
jgi:hypothetical protein